MLVIAAAVLVAIAQVQTAQAATKKATAARRKAAALLEAKAQADDTAEKALVELDRVRVQTAEQLAACRASTEQAQTTARAARAELEEVRAAGAKAVTDAQEAAEAAIQQAIADRDRILAERAAGLRQQIEQAKADAQAQVKAIQNQTDAAKADAEPLVKTLRDELVDATNAATRAELDQPMVAQQPAQAVLATARPHGISGSRTPKMTPVLVDKAQRMYDSGRYTVAEIAKSCAVSPTTIYRHINTGQTKTH